MLVNDTRMGPNCVRWLLSEELASNMEIDKASVDWLVDQGVPDLSIGKFAGNSIESRCMAELPVAMTSSALDRADAMAAADEATGVPLIELCCPMMPVAAVKLILVPVCATTMHVH